MENNQYLDMFIEESQEHLQSLNENLLALESDPQNHEIINEIFRSAHTLKGMAATMGFMSVTNLTHTIENVLDQVRSNSLSINHDIIDALFNSLDVLEKFIENIQQDGNEGNEDISDLLHRLEDFIEKKVDKHIPNPKKEADIDSFDSIQLDEYQRSVVLRGCEQGFIPYSIKVTLDKSCIMKGARAYIIFNSLEQYGEIIYSSPSVEDIEAEKFDFEFIIIILSNNNEQQLYEILNNISEIKSVNIEQIDLSKPGYNDISDNLSYALPNKNQKDKKSHDDSKKRNSGVWHSGKSIRVDIDRLDILMNLISELIIVKNGIEGLEGYKNIHGMAEYVEYLERVSSNLHDAVMKVRMVPVAMVFNRFPRVVRDLSKQLDKDIQLNIEGESTEVDRTIIDEIGDPLIHLIRNCADHGLEHPDERRKNGKTSKGNINLVAYHDGNNVVIEVSDDGKGIDIEGVSNKIVSSGLISSQELENLTQQEIVEYLFHPGFSTAQKISNISGRGVGLDVVKTKIESLGGIVEVDTKKDIGTKFSIRLPLTLSIIQALLVNVGGDIFAIPLNSVKEIMEISYNDIKILNEHRVLNYRNKIIPLIDLNEKLGIDTAENKDKDLYIVVVQKGDNLSAFSINSLIGQKEIVIKSLGKYLSSIKIISGATILGDGKVALILDINRLA